MLGLITDEEERVDRMPLGQRLGALAALVIVMVTLFMTDGQGIVKSGAARLGIMPKAMVMDMLQDIEYNYLYDEIFETQGYQEMRDDLLGRPLVTYSDFGRYVARMALLAKDDFTYFYYDSLVESRDDFSLVAASDYEDDFSMFTEGGIPVIRFSQFAYDTGDRAIEALQNLNRQGAPVVVIDLTDNPGGMIDQCVRICDALLPEVPILDEEFNDLSSYRYVSDPQMMVFERIIILLNRESASCSEIMALALKEHLKDRVILIGDETFGKRVIQNVSQDDHLRYSLYLVTAKWSVNGKTTEDLNGYLAPWRHKGLKGYEDSFQEARLLIEQEGWTR